MKIILILFVLFFSSLLFADDISDFQIEGISIGDSLLDSMSEATIKKEIESTRSMYEYLNKSFGEIYIFDEFQNYDFMSFFVKPDDKNFIIHRLRGVISYVEDLKGCHSKQKEIVEYISKVFKSAKKRETSYKHRIDPTGRSTLDAIIFTFNSGDTIQVRCSNFEEKLRLKNNWTEGLSVIISKNEVIKWLAN